MRNVLKNFRPHLLVLIALLTIGLSGWHEVLRNGLTDLRFRWDQRPASGKLALIAIDPQSIEGVGVWPWPRRVHAELLRQLQRAGIRDVAFDLDFSAPSDPRSDAALDEALRSLDGSVLLPVFKQPAGYDRSELHVNRPLPRFEAHAWPALVNVMAAPDGRVRRYSAGERLDGTPTPSLATALAGQIFAEHTSFLIDFGIMPASIPIVSYIDVLQGAPAALALLRDKHVIVGATALELGDRYSVPNGNIVPGSVLQALATESILQGRMLQPTSIVVTLAGLLAIIGVMILCWRRVPAGWRALLLAAISVLIEAAALLLQSRFALVLDSSLLQLAIATYLITIALDEIDFRGLLRRVAENRFQRIAMSLGDGLVCADGQRLVTVWNPGAAAIFGYAADEIIGKPFDLLCAPGGNAAPLFAATPATAAAARVTGGTVVEFDGLRRNGEVFPVEASVSAWQGADGLQYGAVLRDISARRREAERVRYLAEHDTLTGLANRNTLHARVSDMIAAGAQDGIAFLIIGLDAFQQINDMLGHATGDLVLRATADRLKSELGDVGVVARLSGDEFAVAVRCEDVGRSITEFAEHLARLFDDPLQAGPRQHRVKVSIGVAVHPEGGRTADELLSNSHLALCRAKATQRGGHVIFKEAIRTELESRLTLEAELILALERGEFELFYQPQVDLLDSHLIGAEALIRWRHPERGLVPPGAFIPLVNTSSISDAVGSWVLETGCRQARQWELAGHRIRVGINLSPSQLQSGDLAVTIAGLLARTGLSPELLELEVTEDILIRDEARVLDIFRRIQDLGVRIVFDDFGTGYASLSYLKKFPLDGLKIDRTFVLDLLTDSDDAAIVGSTVSLSHQLGLSVIAEGIENQATAELLLRLGCEHGQGYFFGKPMPVDLFEAHFLLERKPADPQPSGAAA